MTDRIDTNKAQLSALGEHQPLCLATENEALKRQLEVMAELMKEARDYLDLAHTAAMALGFFDDETAIIQLAGRVDKMLAARQQGGAA